MGSTQFYKPGNDQYYENPSAKHHEPYPHNSHKTQYDHHTHNKLNTQHRHQKAHGTVKFLNHGAHGSHTKHSEHHGSGAAHYILSTIHEKKESHGNLLRKVEHKRKDKPGKKKNSNEGRYSDDSGSGSDSD